MHIQIIGVPMDLGQGRRGVDMGPFALRYAGLEARLTRLGCQVEDLGNLTVPGPEQIDEGTESPLHHLPVVVEVNRQLAARCQQAVADGILPLTLGGDHSIAAGSIAGVRNQTSTGVLWLDAHADFNTPLTSPSLNLHGMPLGALLGQEPAELAPFEPDRGLQAEDVVIVGLRSVDGAERNLLREHKVRVFTMRDIDEQGIAEVMRQVLEHFRWRNLEHIHLSFDADSLDPAIAPGVGTPVPGGLTYREAHLAMEVLADDGRVKSVDVVEINPILDDGNSTADICSELLTSLLGQRIL